METDIRDAMLPAGIHAAADLDPDIFVVHQVRKLIRDHALERGSDAGAAGDAQVAGIRPGARRYIGDAVEPCRGKPSRFQYAVDIGKILFRNVP